MKLFTNILTFGVIVYFYLFFITIQVFADSNHQEVINIETSRRNVVFSVTEMVPGDIASREILIFNKGSEDFNYLSKSNFKSGSKKLYEALVLKISNENEEIFAGKLSDFTKLKPRYIESSGQDRLIFVIEMPYELGNEYQGLSSEFEFEFYVEGTLGGVLPVDNKLPTTGSEMFNLLATGAALLLAGLILFAYVKRKKLDTKRP
ncbi:LPXTG cell wall anchor domain-containing protein [Fredinandcohnia onubensis]|uniref:LPXTG cell wall anchor domain-containing protein n=1 Tax=Fredinandcohnia onubensis TaxID=1571209 RepID=UPI000C0BEE1A|nr:LPXTG cell wall anchor domain-containing protein [Fredinandcohnia onubensis]